MKRIWPLAFLLLLFAGLMLRPSTPMRRPIARVPTFLIDPIESPDAARAPVFPADTAAARTPNPEPEGYVPKPLLWMVRHQNEDGSWGDGPATLGGRTIGRAGITALVLLSLMGSGYCHLSKDDVEGGGNMGDVVKKALKWLTDDMREDGSFKSSGDAAFDQAIGAFALSELYGMSASQKYKEPAVRALLSLHAMQSADGSWGGSEPTAWGFMSLASANLADLLDAPESSGRAVDSLERSAHPSSVIARILHSKSRNYLGTRHLELAAAPPSGDGRDFCDWYHGSLSLFQYDGPDGPFWTKWAEPMKTTILGLQSRDGSWPGGTLSHTLVRTSLATQTLQVYYRHINVFAAAEK